MRICRKCKEKFPLWMTIDGKKRNLSGRKFCLSCSPFGSHNTKPDDPSRPAVPHARNGKKYKDWSFEEKEKYLANYYNRGVKRKQKLVDMKGGGCEQCGYNKCLRALSFHHIDPMKKEFSLTSREIAGFSWKKVLAEADKCMLVCYNCHMEIEDKIGRSKYAS